MCGMNHSRKQVVLCEQGATNVTSVVCKHLVFVPARRIILSTRITNEHLYINCTSVSAGGEFQTPHLHKAVTLAATCHNGKP